MTMTEHKFGYTEEKLPTKLTECMKQKQKPHERLAHTKIQKIEKDTNGITSQWDNIKVVVEVKRSQSEQLKNLTAKMTCLDKFLNDRIKSAENANTRLSMKKVSEKNLFTIHL